MSIQADLFAPRVVFEGVVKFYHSGSGENLRWCATRHDIGKGLDGRMCFLRHERSPDVPTLKEAAAFFGPERDLGRKELRKIFPFIPDA